MVSTKSPGLLADHPPKRCQRPYCAPQPCRIVLGIVTSRVSQLALKQRNTQAEKDAIKAGKTAGEIWPDEPARAAQKDTDARWTLKFAKARATPDGKPGIDIAIPSFGYKSSISIVTAR